MELLIICTLYLALWNYYYYLCPYKYFKFFFLIRSVCEFIVLLKYWFHKEYSCFSMAILGGLNAFSVTA